MPQFNASTLPAGSRSLQNVRRQSFARPEPNRAPGYVRNRDLPRLLPVFAEEINASSLQGHARLVCMLRRALRLERRRGICGDWSYDLARHAHLLEAYRTELGTLMARRQRRATHARDCD